jgi:hypothetical protein
LDKSKNECIDDIAKAVYGSKEITKFTAIAGTFYFNWIDGTRTEHDESNWLDCKQLPLGGDLFDKLANASLER